MKSAQFQNCSTATTRTVKNRPDELIQEQCKALPAEQGSCRRRRVRERVAQWEKTLQRIMSGQADASIAFHDLCVLLPHVGYDERRQRGGSHRIFKHPDRPEKIDVQPTKSGKAKPYQVKQVRELLQTYGYEGGGSHV